MRLLNRFRRKSILHIAVERLHAGEDLAEILQDYPTEAEWLTPLLLLTIDTHTLREIDETPPASRVLQQFHAEARLARAGDEAQANASSPWWRRISNRVEGGLAAFLRRGRPALIATVQLVLLVVFTLFLVNTLQRLRDGGLDSTPEPGGLQLPTITPSPLPIPTDTPTQPATESSSPTPSPTTTPSPTVTATITPSPTITPTNTATLPPAPPTLTATPLPAQTENNTGSQPEEEDDDHGSENEPANETGHNDEHTEDESGQSQGDEEDDDDKKEDDDRKDEATDDHDEEDDDEDDDKKREDK